MAEVNGSYLFKIMRAKKSTKYLLVAALAFVVLFGAWLFWKSYGPGWKRLTVKSEEWQRTELEDGRTIEWSTTFYVSDTSDLRNYYFVASSSQVFQVLINHKIVMDKNPFSYYPQTLDSASIQLYKVYESQAQYIGDEKVNSAIRPGYNSLRIWTTAEGVGLYGTNDWKLGAYNEGVSTRYKNDQWSEPYEWKPDPEIPVLYVDVPDYLIPDDPRVRGSSKMIKAGKVIFSADVLLETRGRSSQAFEKKQFNIRTVEKGSKKRMDIQVGDLAPSSDWILYGPYSDLSLIRNEIAYSLSQAMGHYAPKSIPIELVLNNNYRGLYYLMEKIQSQTGRVEIRFDPSDSTNSSNNGFLVQIDQASSKDIILYPSKQEFILEEPQLGYKAENWYVRRTTDQLGIVIRAIHDQISNLDQAIDFKSFADLYIINELSKNVDAYRLSTYLHKTHEDDNPRIFAGPLWDFNLAFGNCSDNGGTKVESWVFDNPLAVDSMWIQLFNHPNFRVYLRDRYAELRKGILSELALNNRIDSLVSSVSSVMPHNNQRFGWPNSEFWPYDKIPVDHNEEIARIKEFLSARLRWMDEELRK
jgi:CotH kinase protein